MKVGNVEVSEQHANFFVTHPGAKADDVLRLIDLVHSKVNEQFGVDLELEIKIGKNHEPLVRIEINRRLVGRTHVDETGKLSLNTLDSIMPGARRLPWQTF